MRSTCVLWLLCACVAVVVAVQLFLLFSCVVSPLFLRLLAVRWRLSREQGGARIATEPEGVANFWVYFRHLTAYITEPGKIWHLQLWPSG